MYYWKINDGRIYGSDEAAFVDSSAVPEGETVTTLYSDTSDASNLVVGDVAFLRQTLIFYGFAIPPVLQNKLEKQEAIQAGYAPQLAAIQNAFTSTQLADGDTTAISTMYTTTRNAMRDAINAVPDDPA